MSANLDTYNAKRDFDRTSEPQGTPSQSGEQLRFAVQHHRASRDHYDLRLEWDGVLLSWAVPKGPSYNPRDKRLAVRVEDHPLDYRTFEGTIPAGEYGGGTVMLWDEGTWEPLVDVEEGLHDGDLKFILHGQRLKGAWVLVHMKPKPGERDNNWLLIKERDEYVRDNAGISDFDTSVETGRTMEEIAQDVHDQAEKNPPIEVKPQLATLVDEAPEGDEWLFEVKYDGYRIIAYIDRAGVRLLTRNGKDYTHRFPDIASSLAAWADVRALILDGEVVITNDAGATDFQALQNYLRNPAGKQPTYMVFDLLAFDGEDVRDWPLVERKQKLASLMQNAPNDLRYSKHVQGQGSDSFEAACKLHLEGVVGKRADAPYVGARNGDWVKVKCVHRQEFVVGGFTRSQKNTTGMSSLLLGVYDDGNLVSVGRVGSGLGEDEVQELEAACAGLERATSPFANSPKPRPHEGVTWLDPALVVEVQFSEWTGDNQLRHPSYKGLRADKDPREVREEKAEEPMATHDDPTVVEGVTITSPHKELYIDPTITKLDVVQYYERMAPRMLPYVSRRILSIVRCPQGIERACFFKKHPGPGTKGVFTIEIPSSDGEPEDYFYLEDAQGLISEAQMDTLEFHVWGSHVDAPEKPDMMVFDLDPDEGLELARIRQGARDLKGILDDLSLTSFLKTSGGKGYHVVVPFEPNASWDAFHDFTRRISQLMAEKWPDRYTGNVRKSARKGKVFIDWLRNGRGATSVAPYSLRARSGAPVSMPLTWDDLDKVAPDEVTMTDALAKLDEADPWEGYFDVSQSLK